MAEATGIEKVTNAIGDRSRERIEVALVRKRVCLDHAGGRAGGVEARVENGEIAAPDRSRTTETGRDAPRHGLGKPETALRGAGVNPSL